MNMWSWIKEQDKKLTQKLLRPFQKIKEQVKQVQRKESKSNVSGKTKSFSNLKKPTNLPIGQIVSSVVVLGLVLSVGLIVMDSIQESYDEEESSSYNLTTIEVSNKIDVGVPKTILILMMSFGIIIIFMRAFSYRW